MAKKQGKMKMYRSITCGLIVLAAALTAVCDDLPYGYRSLGIDTYASGEPVRDGECYALVWVRNGFEFSGYNRDGALVDAVNNAEVFVRAIAVDGQCPPVNFLVPEAFAAAHADGSYTVVVLDTRAANGAPAGLTDAGALSRVNGWGRANVRRDEAVKSSGMVALKAAAPLGSQISNAAKIPATCRQPVITGLSFDAAGNAVVECAATEGYMSYRLAAGETPARVGDVVGADRQDGSGTAEKVRLTFPRDEINGASAAFFRVESVPMTDL